MANTTSAKINQWEYDLRENTMTKDVPDDYTAVVNVRATIDTHGVAQLICDERTDFRLETIETVQKLFSEKVKWLLKQGYIVSTETALYVPGITGLFQNTTLFTQGVNQCVANVSPSKALRDAMEEVTPVYSGHMQDQGGANIEFVYDVTTKQSDGKITPGGMVEVKGKKIRCLNATGDSIGKIAFLNAETQAEVATVPATAVGINDPSRLMFNAPSTLTDGEYILRIETYYSQATTLLKSVRILDYRIPLYVGDKEDDDVEDGPVVQ